MLTSKNLGLLLIVFSLLLIIFLALIKIDVDKRDAFLCAAVHNGANKDMTQCPAHNSNTSWYIVTAFIASFLVMGGGVNLFLSKEKKEIILESLHPVDLAKLDEEEKKIYDLLTLHEGSVYQSDLIKETGFSKVHTTRVLDKMEGKKILERKRRGMTNIIVLK